MYSIRVKVNHLKKEYVQSTKDDIGVRLKSGRIRFHHWRGFTDQVAHPVKLKVDSYTESHLPEGWVELKEGEYLLGSYQNGFVYTVVPFRVL